MRKKILAAMVVAVIAMFAGYNMYQSRTENEMSDLALANVEALADGEVMDGNCAGSWNKECCVCGIKHYMFASVINNRECQKREGCAHFDGPNDKH